VGDGVVNASSSGEARGPARGEGGSVGDGDQSPLDGGPQAHDSLSTAVHHLEDAVRRNVLSPFAMACIKGDVDEVQRRLKASRTAVGELLERREHVLRLSPLLLVTVCSKHPGVMGIQAASHSLVAVAEMLVEHGARVDARCRMGRTAVHYGACAEATADSLAIAELCLKAHPSSALLHEEVRLTGMSAVAYGGAVGRCGGFKLGADGYGRRIVALAASGKSISVKPEKIMLVKTGACPEPPTPPLVDARDRVGCVALIDVVCAGREDVTRVLLDKYSASIDIADSNGTSPLFIAQAQAADGRQLCLPLRRAMARLCKSVAQKCAKCGASAELQKCGRCQKAQ
jgi:hypothetical protein